jgi:hypothetical protein
MRSDRWEREKLRQARCAVLQKKYDHHRDRCTTRGWRRRKSCNLVRNVAREAVELNCGWAF